PPRDLPSFPTRRSSDLIEGRAVRELDMPAKQEVPVFPVLREPLRRQSRPDQSRAGLERDEAFEDLLRDPERLAVGDECRVEVGRDRKSTRLNSSHRTIS